MPDITATREWVEREIADYDHLSKVCAAEWDRTDCARRAAILRWALAREEALQRIAAQPCEGVAGLRCSDIAPAPTTGLRERCVSCAAREALASCPIEECRA